MAAMTINGSGPATPWQSESTFLADLDESVVPDPPSSLRARASDDEIQIMWKPPRDNQILVRGYTIGWGKGIPDEYTKLVEDNQRYFIISKLSKFPCFRFFPSNIPIFAAVLFQHWSLDHFKSTLVSYSMKDSVKKNDNYVSLFTV